MALLIQMVVPEDIIKSLASMDWEKSAEQLTRFLSSGVGAFMILTVSPVKAALYRMLREDMNR